ncbi:molybdate ABC transporter substrate-binding protein [Verrucomicrobiota bacterium sgz303538]
MSRKAFRCLASILFLLALTTVTRAEPLLVSAAASLTDALRETAAAYQREAHGAEITYNFSGSGTLQKQIENGAPVDVFISAAAAQMDALEKQELLLPQTRANLLTNALVLVTLKERKDLNSFADLTAAQVKHIAIGDPRTVPAGQYSVETLEAQKLLPLVESKLVRLLSVRQVLSTVETGNADAGLVYQTDAAISPQVRIVATAPEKTHEPIVYPVAIIRRSKQQEEARKYVAFLQSETARAIFRKYGFTTVQ